MGIASILESFGSTAKNRIKNPFFGTLILVWLYRNWKIPFTYLNFNDVTTRGEKIAYYTTFYKDYEYGSLGEVLVCSGYAFLAMLIAMIISHMTKLLTEGNERLLLENLQKIKSKKVLSIDDLENTLDKNKALNDSNNELEADNHKLRQRIKELEEEKKVSFLNRQPSFVEDKVSLIDVVDEVHKHTPLEVYLKFLNFLEYKGKLETLSKFDNGRELIRLAEKLKHIEVNHRVKDYKLSEEGKIFSTEAELKYL